MKIIFKDKYIVPDLKSTTGFHAIGELVNHLASVGAIAPEIAEPISLAITHREKSMSTGIGFGIAIPHAYTSLSNEIILAFGRSHGGIDFDSLDGQPVRLVVLAVFPAHEKERHLKTLAGISRLLHDKETRAALESARDVEVISSILNERHLAPV